MRNLKILMWVAGIILMMSAARPNETPAFGNLYLVNLPSQAADIEIEFTQAQATPISVLGSQLGYTQGAGTLLIPVKTAAVYFGNAGFDSQKPIWIKIGLLDETGDAISTPGVVVISFNLNPDGPTVINYSAG